MGGRGRATVDADERRSVEAGRRGWRLVAQIYVKKVYDLLVDPPTDVDRRMNKPRKPVIINATTGAISGLVCVRVRTLEVG